MYKYTGSICMNMLKAYVYA